MRVRLFVFAALVAAVGIAAPTLARADVSASLAGSTAATAATTTTATATPAWCIQTALNPGHCLAIPCPVSKLCPPIGAPDAAPAATTATLAAAAPRTATPTIACAPGFQVVCTVLGVVCRTRCYTSAPAAPVAAAPSMYCSPTIQPVCTVLGIVCRSRCEATGAPTAADSRTAVTSAVATRP